MRKIDLENNNKNNKNEKNPTRRAFTVRQEEERPKSLSNNTKKAITGHKPANLKKKYKLC